MLFISLWEQFVLQWKVLNLECSLNVLHSKESVYCVKIYSLPWDLGFLWSQILIKVQKTLVSTSNLKIQLYMVHFLEIYSKNNILAQTLHHITDKFMKSIFIEMSKPIDNVEKMDTKNMLRYRKNKAADIDPEIVWIPEAGEIFCGNPQVCQLVSLCLTIDQPCVFVLD